MKDAQVTELLLQSLECEKGGVQLYEAALKCAAHPELAGQWQKFLDQTRMHVRVLTEIFAVLKLDPYQDSPGRQIVRQNGAALVQAIESGLQSAPREAAQLIACECVVLAETKDHSNWELIGQVAKNMKGEAAEVLTNAYEQIEEEEDGHVYHSKGWCRELWLQSLGLKAVLPPPEDTRDVRSMRQEAEVMEERRNS